MSAPPQVMGHVTNFRKIIGSSTLRTCEVRIIDHVFKRLTSLSRGILISSLVF